jgi:hypothetical protein
VTDENPDPPLLEYRAARDDRRQAPQWVQSLSGFLACGVLTAAMNFAGGFLLLNVNNGFGRAALAAAICAIPVVIFYGAASGPRRRGRWPTFLPAAMIGWGVAALIEGVCYMSLLARG